MRALLIVILLATVAHAQPPRAPNAPAPHDRREAVKKKIRAMRAYTLTEELALDEKAAAKLFPILAKWDDVTDKLLQARVDIQRRLTLGTADPKQLDKLIDEAVANQKAFWDLEAQRLAELRKVLTPAQTARLLLVLPAFERKIQNQLRRAINRRANATRPAPDDFDEDDLDLDDAPGRRR